MPTQEESFLQSPISWQEVERLRAIKRITQRDLLASSVKRRSQDVGEREYAMIVAPAGGVGDTSDIQEAVESVHNLGGGSIFIKSGRYYPRGNIYLYSNISLIGEDADNTIIDFGNAAHNFRLHGTSGSRKKGVHFKNLQVHDATVIDDGAISFLYTDDCSVRNCKFAYNWWDDVKFKESTGGVVEDCYSDPPANFVYFEDSSGHVARNIVKNSTGYGVVVEGDGYLVSVSENVFINLGCEALWVDQMGTLFSNNYLLNNTTANGVHLRNTVEGVKIIYNLFYSTDVTAKGIFTDASDCIFNIISGNFFLGDWDIGIYLDDGDNNQLTNNAILEAGDAIVIDASCNRTLVTGNNFYGSTAGLTNNGTNTEIGHNIGIA